MAEEPRPLSELLRDASLYEPPGAPGAASQQPAPAGQWRERLLRDRAQRARSAPAAHPSSARTSREARGMPARIASLDPIRVLIPAATLLLLAVVTAGGRQHLAAPIHDSGARLSVLLLEALSALSAGLARLGTGAWLGLAIAAAVALSLRIRWQRTFSRLDF
jgi:hypothetical protein